MQDEIIVKFCIVGESSVGKTSLLHQYILKKFKGDIKATIGCDFSTKMKFNIKGKSVRLQIWDIAGGQRFNSVSKMYLRGAVGCAIVCSSESIQSLEKTLMWKKSIQQNCDIFQGTIPCLLVQNKSDLIGQNEVFNFQKQQFLEQFRKQHQFFDKIQVSAKKNKNVQQMFKIMVEQAINRGLLKIDKKTQNKNDNQSIIIKKADQKFIKKKSTC